VAGAKPPKPPVYRRGWLLPVAFFVGVLVGHGGGGDGTPAPAPTTTVAEGAAVSPTPTRAPAATKPAATAAPAAAKPRVLLNVTGSGIKRTRTFTVDSSWEVRWTNQTSGYFGIYVEDASGSPVGVAANTTDRGHDVWPGVQPGTYCLEINATGRWAVQVVDTP